jgi:hypothetical protein
MSSRWIKWGSWGAVLAASALTLSGVLAFVFPGPNMGPEGSLSWYLIESSDAVAEVGVLAALVGLHVRQTPRYGRLGTAGFLIAFTGTVLFIVSTVMWLLPLTDGIVLDVLFNGGALGWLVGYPLLGVATLRAAVLPRWCGVLLTGYVAYFIAVFFLVDFYGEARALFGPVWLAVAYALWSQRSATVMRSHAELGV